MITAQEIVRELAEADPVIQIAGVSICGLCRAFTKDEKPLLDKHHRRTCPYRHALRLTDKWDAAAVSHE